MKRVISCLLLLIISFSLVACGGSTENNTDSNDTITKNESNKEVEENWSIGAPVDEFGDVVENGQLYIQTEFSGDFSNTATSGSGLKGLLYMYQAEKGMFDIYFKLFEYGEHPASYYETDVKEGIVLKTKINNTVREYNLIGNPPNGDLMIYEGDGSFYNDLANNEGEMKCVIYINSSQYNFTIHTGNIKEVSESAFGILEDGINSMGQAIGAFANRNMHVERYAYLMEHMYEYPTVKDDELVEMFDDKYWLTIWVEETSWDDWYVHHFVDNKRFQILRLLDGELTTFDGEKGVPFKIQDNKLHSGFVSAEKESYEENEGAVFRKLGEGYYIVEEASAVVDNLYNYQLYIECDEKGAPIHEFKDINK